MFIICVSYIIKINYFPEKRRESSQKLNNLLPKYKSRNLRPMPDSQQTFADTVPRLSLIHI